MGRVELSVGWVCAPEEREAESHERSNPGAHSRTVPRGTGLTTPAVGSAYPTLSFSDQPKGRVMSALRILAQIGVTCGHC